MNDPQLMQEYATDLLFIGFILLFYLSADFLTILGRVYYMAGLASFRVLHTLSV